MDRPSPLQNRVLPTGDIVADPARGMFTGNRGILPLTNGTLGTSRWKHQHWIICTLNHPRGRYHGPLPAKGWTPLFFLDEAVALAAGHRPCAYCRPEAYHAFKEAWHQATGTRDGHDAIDRALHKARVTRTRQQIHHRDHAKTLPCGAMVLDEGKPYLVHQGYLLSYAPAGYTQKKPLTDKVLTVLTPSPTIAALRKGFLPTIHSTANMQ